MARFTTCALRNNLYTAYSETYALHKQIRNGTPVNERQLSSLLSTLAANLTCCMCGTLIERLDTNAFLARCGHVYCKTPNPCWANAGHTCTLCPRPARPEY